MMTMMISWIYKICLGSREVMFRGKQKMERVYIQW